MVLKNSHDMLTRWNRFSMIIACGILLLGILGLTGYFTVLTGLGSIKPEYIPMAPSTAVGFIVFGLIFISDRTDVLPRYLYLVENVFVLLITIFGLLEVLGQITGADLNLENTLVKVQGTINGAPVGLMSPATGAVFFLAGISLLIFRYSKTGKPTEMFLQRTGATLAAVVMTVAFVFCLAYLYKSPLLYDENGAIPMALTTAMGFLLLSFSLLAAFRGTFPVRFLTEKSWRSYLLRYLLPVTVIAVVLGGWSVQAPIAIFKEVPAIQSLVFSIFVVVLTFFLSTLLANHIGRALEIQQNERKKVEMALQESEELYRNLFETMAQGVVYQNASGEIISANPAAEEILGLSLSQMKGRTSIDPRWKAVDAKKNDLPGAKHPAMTALQTGQKVKNFIQGIYNTRKSRYVWIVVNSVPQFREGENKAFQVYSTFLDITARKEAEDELLALKNNLQEEVEEKTLELKKRIDELEHFHKVTIDREIRMEELRNEIELLKKQKPE